VTTCIIPNCGKPAPANEPLCKAHREPPNPWRDFATAPRDGTAIQARIPGHGEDNIIAYVPESLLDSAGGYCGAWAFVTDQEPPECWTDGWCWHVNEDGVQSVQPTHWKLPPASADECEGKK